MNAEALDTLRRMDACSEAVEWVATQPDPATAWARCERGDWMLWLLAHTGADRGTLVLAACDVAEEALRYVLAACDVAEEALRYVPAGEDRPARAISTARAWVRGEATVEEVRAAARAADRDAADADAAAAAYAAYAAADAAAAAHGREPAARADAAGAAAYAADAAGAAATAAYAADDAARADARRASLARSADLVRARFPSPPELR